MTAAIRRFNRFQPDVVWLRNAAHCPQNFPPNWELDQFVNYQNVCEAGFETPTRFTPELNIVTDEAKSFFWLGITPARENVFARVKAGLTGDALTIKAANTKEASIDLDKVSKLTTFSRFDIQADTPLHLTVMRGGKTLFETAQKKGALPADLFKK